jgi:predicted transcriptional regulator of viral defense system
MVGKKKENGSMRWTQLTKIVVKKSPSPWQVQVIIRWLLEKGYIERLESGLYVITEKERALLKSI